MRILIVEDEALNSMYVAELLKLHKYPFDVVVNGTDAIRKCQLDSSIGLVLMDIKMSGMSGYEATRRIKSIRPNLPIVALTAYALPDDKAKAMEAGCDAHLAKPVKANDLIHTIKRYMK